MARLGALIAKAHHTIPRPHTTMVAVWMLLLYHPPRHRPLEAARIPLPSILTPWHKSTSHADTPSEAAQIRLRRITCPVLQKMMVHASQSERDAWRGAPPTSTRQQPSTRKNCVLTAFSVAALLRWHLTLTRLPKLIVSRRLAVSSPSLAAQTHVP